MRFLRRHPARTTLPDAWRDILDKHFWLWANLDDAEQDELGDLTARLLSEKRWEAANGFALDPEMTLLIAAQASVLVLGLGFDHFSEVGTIIVHPTTVVLTGARYSPVRGLMTDGPEAIDGQAVEGGPLVIAWDAVLHDLVHHGGGYNVVFHEFAHKLDMLDRMIDGTPPLPPERLARWVEVCTREYESLRAHGDDVLRDYAAVNPAEFFAVVTETFFDAPHRLRSHKPDLYGVFADFYNQDPASRPR